jgi:hypothetical protein
MNDRPQIYDWENEYKGTLKRNKSEAIEIHPVEYWHENYLSLLRKPTADEKEQKNWLSGDFVYSCNIMLRLSLSPI